MHNVYAKHLNRPEAVVEDLVGHLQRVPRRRDLPHSLSVDGGLVLQYCPDQGPLPVIVSVVSRSMG